MSGGRFGYQQHRITDIATEIEHLIKINNAQDLDEYGQKIGRNYPPEIIERFKLAVDILKCASAMAHEIDWLVSGDNGEDSFLRCWKEHKDIMKEYK